MRRLLLMLVLVAGGLLPGEVRGQEATPAAQTLGLSYPELRLVATDHAFTIGGQATAGLTLVTLVNDGHEVHHAQLLRLAEGQTIETMQAALDESPEAIVGLGSFVGGPSAVAPESQTQVILLLDPGQYVALCFIESPDGRLHLEQGMVREFAVTGTASSSAEPDLEPAATIVMRDHTFALPARIAAGPQLWEIVNEGPQAHEIAVLKLGAGITPDQALALLAEPPASPASAEPPASGPPPFVPVGGTTALAAGLRVWAVLALPPGDYLALCFVPDEATGTPHLMLGMIQHFTVE